MHPLKKHILYQLILNSHVNFAKLKPDGTEGNIFTYHLKQLINEDLVQKRADGEYELTEEGQKYADKATLKNLTPRAQPKIVTLLICQNQKGQYLLYERKRQPFLNLVGFPYGKIHLGEKVIKAGERELKEKTGLSAKLTHMGNVYLNNLLTHMLCHIILAKNPQGKLIEQSEIGQCFWDNLENIPADKLMPGVTKIYQLVKKKKYGFFFEEFFFNI